MKKEHEVTVTLKERFGKEAFAKTYRIALWDDFVGNKNPKEHGFLAHTTSFIDTLIMNNTTLTKPQCKKRDVYVVKFGLGVGTEIS